MTPRQFGAQIKMRRLENHLKREELAELLWITPLAASRIQRLIVLGCAMLARSLRAEPSFDANLASRFFSLGVTITRFGSLLRRISFSTLRYRTCRASCCCVEPAIRSSRDWYKFFIGIHSKTASFAAESIFCTPAAQVDKGRRCVRRRFGRSQVRLAPVSQSVRRDDLSWRSSKPVTLGHLQSERDARTRELLTSQKFEVATFDAASVETDSELASSCYLSTYKRENSARLSR